MPITLLDKHDSIGIRISNKSTTKFQEMLEIVKELSSGFIGRNKTDYKDKYWKIDTYDQLVEVLSKLIEIDEDVENIDLLEKFKNRHLTETSKFRINLNPSLLKSDPIGNFQIRGIEKGIKQNRLMLAWEMGLGKTYTIISIINHLWEKSLIDSVLVIAPSESIYNFRREFLKFNSFNLKEEDFYIANVKNRDPFNSNAKIIIMTYRTFLMLSDDEYKKQNGKSSKNYRKSVLPIGGWGNNRAIILDESHNLKNRSARQSKVLNLHKDYFNFRYMLTGTPDPNGIEGFYNQINFLDKYAIGRDYFSWLKSIAALGTKWSPYGVRYFYEDKVADFVESIKPWVMREYTKDNIDLPDLLINKVYVELSFEQRKIYEELITYTLSVIKEEYGEIIPKVVENKFPFILQALDNPSLLKDKIDPMLSPSLYNRVKKWKFNNHSKLEICSSLISKYIEDKKKVILWSGHPLTMNELAIEYKKYNPTVIHGQIEVPKNYSREEYKTYLLENFKNDKNQKLLIASYYVLSTAVNITEAPRSIYFDRSINPTAWMQSVKRNHRIGQDETVIVNPLIFEKTYDERLDRELDRKDKLNNNLMNKDSLTIDEWKSLFLGDRILE
jgi:SNF2 family DNA or RNA helicase